MKIAVSSTGKELSDSVAELFGRCPYFVIAEIENGKTAKTDAIKNENESQVSGAGVSAVKLLAENNVDVVIAKTVGPRAMDILEQFNIKIYNGEGTVEDVIRKFIDKK